MKLPLGYRYAATYAGIRKVNKEDLGLIVSDEPASAAAVFTTNRVQAAPVKLARQHLRASRGRVSAIVVNAGNANCATRNGEEVALTTCKAVAKMLKVPVAQVIPASTGVIGVELDPQLIVNALPKLKEDLIESRFPDVSHAIMTTDTVPKEAFAEVQLKGGEVLIAGMAKGSGMIHPNMATTLGFVMMDAAISPIHLRQMLVNAVERSFNRLSVDGDTSTNDIVVLLANGASGIKPSERERRTLEESLSLVMEDLTEQIARDGEGATKLITIRVVGAADEESASRIARSIANSPLVKTAIAGSDPNWGRVLSAAGNAGVDFDPNKVDIYMNGVLVCSGGLAADFSEADLKQKLDERECLIRLELRGDGKGETRFWTCDFTEGYIKINASYRT
ncbi:MAG TPA: bifunctional glutamate N-acetyltransferase/amino-acid acetyltransferase ArgJ [Bryobacteraceae bacterium]|nr:bifunctional glutamate N-acetyltransferase/amino-acid acetyltransferase ArgJ [Bryobacteraceae bacterium]